MPIWIIIIEWISRLILVLLFFLSVWAWSVIISKRKYFKELKNESALNDLKNILSVDSVENVKNKISENKNFLSDVLKQCLSVSKNEQVEKIFSQFILIKKKQMEEGLSILGTLGSTTPFIGLLGTIMGIIVSFGELSRGLGDMNQVMYSLAEALVLTAVGLFVAIPSVISFNIFNKKIKNHLIEAEALKDFYLATKK